MTTTTRENQLNTLEDVDKMFPDELSAKNHLAIVRWGQWASCPYCGNSKAYFIEENMRYKCANKKCYKKFSVTVKTVIESSNIPLNGWIKIFFLYAKKRGRISTVEIEKEIPLTIRAALLVTDRIDFVWRFVDRENKSTLEIINELFKKCVLYYDKYLDYKTAPFYNNPYNVRDIDNIGDSFQYYKLIRHVRYYINVFCHWIFIKDFASPEDILAETFLRLKEESVKEYNTEKILSEIWKTVSIVWIKFLKNHPKYNEKPRIDQKKYGLEQTRKLTDSYVISAMLKTKHYKGYLRQELKKRKDLIDVHRRLIIKKRSNKWVDNSEFISHF